MIRRIFFILILFAAALAADEYYYSREWLNLLYYEKTWTGYRSTAASADFFVFERGRDDPQAEYEAALRLVKANDAQFKAKFPLRYKYIARQNNLEYVPAVTLTENITKIVLAYPNRYMQNPVSMFGHLFLVLETERGFLDSKILHYVADTRGDAQGLAYAFKGLTGGYRGAFYEELYYKKIKEYNYLEDREVLYYDLNLAPEQIEDLRLHCIELRNTFFHYYFLDANCAYYIGKFLNVILAKDSLCRGLYVLPAELINSLHADGLLRNERTRPTATRTFHYLYNNLNNGQKAQVRALLTAEIEDTDADVETLKTFLAISEFILSNKSDYAGIIRHNRILAYRKLNTNNADQTRPAMRARENAPNIKHNSLKLMIASQESAEWSFSPIHFSSGAENDALEIKDVKFFGGGAKSYKDKKPRYNFDLLAIDNLAQSNSLLPAVSWSAKSQFSFQRNFTANQELYLGCAFNLLNNGLFYFLLGGNYANYDDLAEKDLEHLRLTSGGKTGVKQNLFQNGYWRLEYANKYQKDYLLAELAYKWGDLLGRITCLNASGGQVYKLGAVWLF
ncbi:MAG: DUF4105 domain-containing protein [Candidatus Margulisbacteria bacterium]|jgi:hypothetical protein|nr:DUF4105 domain-containing protein [Candidatus Margulisiibacteriota bacterium]